MEKEWLDLAIGKIRLAGAGKVFVQAPEGLKMQLQAIGSALEKAGIEAVLSCEPCFGACDLKDAEAKRLGCELLLHIGHSDMAAKTALPVIYEEYALEADPLKIMENSLGDMHPHKKLGLATTIQYLYLLNDAKNFLESKGFVVIVGKGSGRAKYPGQILGCDHGAATSIEGRVDALLFMGTGKFHSLGLLAATKKPVFFLDLENKRLEDITSERDRLERIRFANIEKAKNCNAFGVIISTKPGQSNLAVAEAAKKKLESRGRNAWILAMDAITPEKLLGLKLDCLVNCSCPRLSEDAAQFKKPIIGPEDVGKL